MTNQEQHDTIKRCVEEMGVRNLCFCKGAHKQLCATLEVAGADPQTIIQIGRTRRYIPGMRGCCLSCEKVLAEAAKILEVENPAQT